MTMRIATIFLLLIGLLTACGAPADGEALASTSPRSSTGGEAVASTPPLPSLEPDARRVPGIITYYDEGTEDVITLPDTIRAGEAFQVTITTFGGGCESAGGADVAVVGSVATITVYDHTVAGPAVSCLAVLKRLPRSVTLTFPEPGDAVIRIEGQRVDQNTTGEGVPAVLEEQVTVQ